MKQSVRLEKESVLGAMREMYASGIIPTRRNWNAHKPSGQPLDRTISKMFGEWEWSNVVAMAFDVEIKCKTSWGMATKEKRRELAVDLVREISAQLGHPPDVIEWDEERPHYVPRAQYAARSLFGITWSELTTQLVVDDIGEMKTTANSLRWGGRGIKVTGMKMKRIWIGDGRYRTVIAGECK